MNTIYGKILWRTSLPVLLLLFLAVRVNSLSSIPLGRKNTTLFIVRYRLFDHSSTTDTCAGKAKDGDVD